MSKTKAVQFFSQVKQEVLKITWSTRRDTLASTIMVLIMVVVSAAFFWVIDLIIFKLIQAILGL